MLMAEAGAEKVAEEIQVETLLTELWHLHHSLSLEGYFKMLDKFVDQARSSLVAIPDPRERERQREQYRQVIEFAVDLACGTAS